MLAVLDWELSTLGDPLADFTYLLMHWVMPAERCRSGLAGLDLAALGIPTLEETVALYCRATGRDGLPDLDWYFAYNLFRFAGSCKASPAASATAPPRSPQAMQYGERVEPLARAAWDYAVRAGA